MKAAAEHGFLHGKPTEVAPGKIEDALRGIWRQAAHTAGGSVSRACLLTLIGVAADAGMHEEVEASLDAASRRLPSRTILLALDPRAPEGLTATINTNFHEEGANGPRQLYSEEIHLKAGGAAVRRLANMVQTLRVTDVPAVLFWPGEAPAVDDPALELLDGVDRLVVDSRDYRDARDLVALHRLAHGRVTVGDLTWQRLFAWRTLIAHLFDGPPFAEYLRQLDRVTLTRSGSHATGTYLLAGWLASRLGWAQPMGWEADEDSEAWHLIRPDGRPVVLIIRSAPGFHPGLNRVGLESAHHAKPVSVVLERGARVFKLRGTGMPARTRTLTDYEDEELLVQALRSPEEDYVITQALSMTDALLSTRDQTR